MATYSGGQHGTAAERSHRLTIQTFGASVILSGCSYVFLVRRCGDGVPPVGSRRLVYIFGVLLVVEANLLLSRFWLL